MSGRLIGGALLLILVTATAHAQSWYEPARGSKERRAIMDAMRPVIEAKLDSPIEFVVHDLRVLGTWAFARVIPQRPGGGRIDLQRTMLRDFAEHLDGVRTEAILQRRNGRWYTVDHAIGATDVWFLAWCDRLPRGLLSDYCGP
ncbi:MAG TPA: hypothetical protein VF226_01180 [Hyphomicrobiaceae bacterium]|jgi:hypothetical protein